MKKEKKNLKNGGVGTIKWSVMSIAAVLQPASLQMFNPLTNQKKKCYEVNYLPKNN